MDTIKCQNNCCTLNIFPYDDTNDNTQHKTKHKKAGVILHNVYEDRILMIQSRGNLWGFPKGSFELGETFKDCAIRECFEETGIKIDKHTLNTFYKVNEDVCYYYVIYNENFKVNVEQNNYNDASGIGWIKIDCLTQIITENNNFNINFHAKKCLLRFFKKNFLK